MLKWQIDGHYVLFGWQVERGIINLAGAKVQYTEDKQAKAAVSL